MPASKNGVRDLYLVTLAQGVARRPSEPPGNLPAVAEVARALVAVHGGQVLDIWEHAAPGFVLQIPEGRARALARDPRVEAVEQDAWLSAPVGECYGTSNLSNPWALPSNTVSPQWPIRCDDPDPQNDTGPIGQAPRCQGNWGIDRIDQLSVARDQSYFFDNNGRNGTTTVHVYVLDTGIEAGHQEFLDASTPALSRVVGGAYLNPSFPGDPPSSDTDDCYGHGTAVAAVIGGRTYGVAKDVLLHPVRIANCSGGNMTSARRGLEWIAANRVLPAVMNWSGANSDPTWLSSTALRTALQGVIDTGVIVVQAAGNQSPSYDPQQPLLRDACEMSFGGTIDSVIVVGGSDENDERWTRRPGDPFYAEYCSSLIANPNLRDCGSNTGACIDIWAPAAHVITAWMDSVNQYCRISGTSLAAPHAAGAIALYLEDHPAATSTEVVNALRSLGTWGALQANSNDPNWIGPGSDNVLLYSLVPSPGLDLPPTARYTVTCSGRRCSFNAATSTDDFGIASYSWNFGDGTALGSGVAPVHVFSANARPRVHLTVTDTFGRTDNYSQIVEVGNDLLPTASFTFTCSGLVCSFNGTSSSDDVGINGYSWNFGDGSSPGTTSTVTHTFPPGRNSYTVTLTVTDTSNGTDPESRLVTVTDEPVAAAETYFAITPCRVYDSRNPLNKLSSGQPRIVQITTACNIPPTAKAVSFNLTVVEPTGDGHVVLYPGDQSPGSTSVINFTVATSPRANNAVVRLGGNGTVGMLPYVQGSGQVHVILDVQGYFSESTAGLKFQTLPPCRLADTRPSSAINAGEVRSFTIKGSHSGCTIPNDAKVASLNVTVTQPGSAGHVTLFEAGTTMPGVSNINFPASIFALANGARTTLATSLTNDLSVVYASVSPAQTHLLLDINGYFSPTAPYSYRPITPCRAVDTRFENQGGPTPIASGVTRNFQIQGNCGVPVGAKAAVLNVTVVGQTAGGHLTAFPSGSPLPGASTLNFDAGGPALANGTIVPLSTGAQDLSVSVYAPVGSVHVIVDVFGYFQP